ncbi:YihY/virulence factor BrkB family protein [Gordonia rhizosphera]|uniref:Putative ribonuclease n=1 Tax=Gordonia rhizosphera NBRC 16068 TaxID=1108045 RepID=K6WYN9_9ACTN|nr:YihY/virulence factor BrkB family protein [Gordonia rhizosphera]GAB91674.1 putative ribonuclease [Gordonia rhizosphera NBRC 16068]
MHALWGRLRVRLPPRIRAVADLAVATVKDSGEDRITGLASEIAFWVVLSLPAVALAIVSLAGLLDPLMGADARLQLIERIEEIAGQVFRPETVDNVIAGMLNSLLIEGSPPVFSIAFAIAVFTVSRILRVVVLAVTIAYDLDEERPTWMARVLGLIFAVVGLVIGVVVVPVVVGGPQLGYILERRWGLEALPLGEIWTVAYWPVAVVGLTLVVAALFHWATPRRTPFHRDLPGALLATASGLVISAGLRLYTGTAFGGGGVYAPLAAPLAILVWVWLMAIVLLFGAELNAEIEKAHPSNGWPPPRRRTPVEVGATAAHRVRRVVLPRRMS